MTYFTMVVQKDPSTYSQKERQLVKRKRQAHGMFKRSHGPFQRHLGQFYTKKRAESKVVASSTVKVVGVLTMDYCSSSKQGGERKAKEPRSKIVPNLKICGSPKQP